MRNTELQKNPNHIGKSEFFPDFQIIPAGSPDRNADFPPDGSLGEFGAVHSSVSERRGNPKDLRFRPHAL